MYKTKKLIFIILITFSQIAFSSDSNFPNDKKGFVISPDVPGGNGIVQKSGDVYTFEGDLCTVKLEDSYHDKDNGEEHKEEHKEDKTKCYKVS
jgi:hypothetical protein